MIALEILGYFLLFIVLLILILILEPIVYHMEGQKYENTLIKANISLLFGGIKIVYDKMSGKDAQTSVTILGFSHRKGTGRTKKEHEKKKRKSKRKPKVNYFKKDLLKMLFEAAGDLLSHIKPKKFEVDGAFGLGEPFDTAMLWLLILSLPLHHRNFDISLHPVFDDEVLEGRFIIEGRIVLAVILWIAVKLRLSRPVKNILKERKRKVYAN
jgi:hypothetical protein